MRGDHEAESHRHSLASTGDRGGRSAEAVIAEAEYRADEIRQRARADGKRVRSRAVEEGRVIRIEAQREALEILRSARVGAIEIIAEARREEAELNDRMRRLRRVVEETEEFLESLDGREGSISASDSRDDAASPDFQVVIAAEQSRVERQWRDESALDAESILPESVRQLLAQLKCGGL